MAIAVHPFPARMAPEIALAELDGGGSSVGGERRVVLDPMCGSGTVVAAAARRGYRAIGLDIDPLAVLMTRVATTDIPSPKVLVAGASCLSAARGGGNARPPWTDVETDAFAHFWFAPDQFRQLSNLAAAIRYEQNYGIRNALWVAFSRLIITKSPKASRAADTAHSRPHRVVSDHNFDVYEGFDRSLAKLAALPRGALMSEDVLIRHADARDVNESLIDEVDLTITSPPYLNAIDYLRGHRLTLIWMGYSIDYLRSLRRSAIGSELGIREQQSTEDALLDDVIHPVVLQANRPLLRRYVRDINRLSSNLHRWTKVGGSVISVVGDSTQKGHLVHTAKLVEESLRLAGFRIDEVHTRDIPENRRYLPVNNAGSSLGGRMRQEHVLRASKVAS